MNNIVQNVCKLSQNLFRSLRSGQTVDENNLSANFVKYFSQVTLQDLSVNLDDMRSQTLTAPLTYTSLFENELFSLTLFGFRNMSSFIPLHDHPNMFGFAKCVYGTLAIKSYDILSRTCDIPFDILRRIHPSQYCNLVPSVYLGESVVSADSPVCELTPTERNLHEIRPLSDFAVMADIISPPYTIYTDSFYYAIVDTAFDQELNQQITWLLKSRDPPRSYYCDSIPYRGPPIRL